MPTYSVQTRGGSEIGRTTSKSRARGLAKNTANAHNEPVQIVWEASVYGRRSYRNLWVKPSRRKNPMSKKIVGVALNPSGKFLGFIDGGGRIRRGRVRRIRNPVISTPKSWARQKAEGDKRYQVSIHHARVPTRAFDTLTKARDLIRRAKSYHGTHWDIYDRETGSFLGSGIIP